MTAFETTTPGNLPGDPEQDSLAQLIGTDSVDAPRLVDGMAAVPDRLEALGIRRPLVVVSREAIGSNGHRAMVDDALGGVRRDDFDRFTPNPTVEECVEAALAANAHGADAVIAIGGGTAIDIAKMAAAGAADPSALDASIRLSGTVPGDTLPIVAVPTTSGTGAEATHFAAVYVEGVKRSVAHPSLLPSLAVLEPSFHEAMPPPLAATTGLDALCQAMESIWAVGGDEQSRHLAMRGGRLVADALVPSVRREDPGARRRAMVGAHLAGRAINISKTTLSHALSYMITQVYGVPHGHAVALTLGAVAEANANTDGTDCADPAGPEEVCRRVRTATGLLGATPTSAIQTMRSILTRLQLAPSLASVGVTRADLPKLARAVDPVRMSNNPRRLDLDALIEILERSWVD